MDNIGLLRAIYDIAGHKIRLEVSTEVISINIIVK